MERTEKVSGLGLPRAPSRTGVLGQLCGPEGTGEEGPREIFKEPLCLVTWIPFNVIEEAPAKVERWHFLNFDTVETLYMYSWRVIGVPRE